MTDRSSQNAEGCVLSQLYGEIGETGMIRANLGNGTSGMSKRWACVDEMEAQRERTPTLEVVLQKTLRPEPCDWVCDWQTLPPENPAGHCKAYRRVAQMHHSHIYPPIRIDSWDPQGRKQHQTLSSQ